MAEQEMNQIVQTLIDALGPESVRIGDAIEPRYLGDWSGRSSVVPLAVILPRSVDEVATILRLCNEAHQSVVPQGGMTGLAGGSIPSGGDVCISMERLVGMEELDEAAATMTVLAGTTLQTVQEAAQAAGFEFALDLGARGSCQIGGNLATNAGGIRVLQSGTAREQVLGLEAVLADGSIVSSMNKMVKNNTGYDLRNLFIGSEGTLGIITRAVLRLKPQRAARSTALCALNDYDGAVALLRSLQSTFGDEIGAFEIMWPEFYDFGVSVTRSGQSPLGEAYPLYALIEQAGFSDDRGERFAAALSAQLEAGVVLNAVIAQSQAETQALWAIREATAELPVKLEPINFDVSLPIGEIGHFVDACRKDFGARWPTHYGLYFGHIGDSNLHVTLDARSIPGVTVEEVDHALYGMVRDYNGSISAEHGIGLLKRPFLGYSRSPAELACMHAIKNALDPRGILNPGKVLPAEGT
jgi:FAD/FMN-containing dehydrogenase